MSLSKKIRFEVFKRDGFTCGYCGHKPPAVILEVDHIIPISKGGKDDINNLITACFDCNRGKGKNMLQIMPETLNEKTRILEEKKQQLKAFEKLLRSEQKRLQEYYDKVNKIYSDFFPDWKLSDVFLRNSVKIFISKLPITEIEDAMYIACSKLREDPDNAIRYFCGICYTKIRNNENKNE